MTTHDGVVRRDSGRVSELLEELVLHLIWSEWETS